MTYGISHPEPGARLGVTECPGIGERGHGLTMAVIHGAGCCREWEAGREAEAGAQDEALTADFDNDRSEAEREYYAHDEAAEVQLRAELDAAGNLSAYLCGTLDQAEAESPEAEIA
jgi:hypothetical protein